MAIKKRKDRKERDDPRVRPFQGGGLADRAFGPPFGAPIGGLGGLGGLGGVPGGLGGFFAEADRGELRRKAPLGFHVNRQGQIVPNRGRRLGQDQTKEEGIPPINTVLEQNPDLSPIRNPFFMQGSKEETYSGQPVQGPGGRPVVSGPASIRPPAPDRRVPRGKLTQGRGAGPPGSRRRDRGLRDLARDQRQRLAY